MGNDLDDYIIMNDYVTPMVLEIEQPDVLDIIYYVTPIEIWLVE